MNILKNDYLRSSETEKVTPLQTYTLDCGLRIVCAPSPTDVVYCGIAVDAGTRDELPHESGMAHFTEHLTFKGTARRKSWHILNRLETVGGDLNAYTGKEETVYYCTFLKEHFSRAIDLLLDITLHSSFPQHEMDKEVEVVVDEIESYNDTPSELIFDEFEGLVFQHHPLGRNILGQAERLREFRSEDVQQFTRRLYVPSRMVLFVYGNIPMKRIVREAEKNLGQWKKVNCHWKLDKEAPLTLGSPCQAPSPRLAPAPFEAAGKTIVRHKDTHQAHVMYGTRGLPHNDPRHLSLYVLNNILGGPGMNSRFSLALRERNGLVYTVESVFMTYTDTGLWGVYFGCDPDDVDRCLRLIRKELQRLTAAPLSPSALAAYKRQIIGQLGISHDAFESVAIGMGKRYLHYGTTPSREKMVQQIQALTAEQLHQTALEIFRPEEFVTLIYK